MMLCQTSGQHAAYHGIRRVSGRPHTTNYFLFYIFVSIPQVVRLPWTFEKQRCGGYPQLADFLRETKPLLV